MDRFVSSIHKTKTIFTNLTFIDINHYLTSKFINLKPHTPEHMDEDVLMDEKVINSISYFLRHPEELPDNER